MPEENYTDYATALLTEFNTKLRDMEEKQKLLKERVLLIGENLIEARENINSEITEMKLDLEGIKGDIKRIKNSLLSISGEIDKRARKSELELLQKQMKMFSPLEFARIEDVKKLLEK